MDSDDDFMTDGSSGQEFLDTQGSDNESLGGDFEEDLGGSFNYEKDIKPVRQPYETDSTALSPNDITREQNVQINEVSSILGLPAESAAILLRFSRWNREKLIESYMDHPEKTLEDAGLGPTFSSNPKTEVMHGFMCDICCEDGPDLQTYAMRCGHRFCVDCYSHYLGQKIKEEGEAARIECPQDQCHRIIDSKSLDLLVGEDVRDRYRTLLIRTYVDDMPNLKWCPAPNCEFAVRCGVKERDLDRVVPTVHCACSFAFCFGCDVGNHQPCPCALVKKWVKKCKDDSETANWISANTKECPKCHSTIEKNGGCNHMTCRKCKHEFCWMCLGPWSEHGTSWYNCNRFEEKGSSDARDTQTRSRQSLERYLHYYNRFANHEQSAKLDRDLFLKTEKMMVNLQSQSGLSWIEVQFLDTASRTLQECRQTLKWTYAFAFYLARNNLTEIFEDNQRDLEMAVENLSEMFEKPISELAGLKVDILDKTSYCNKRRVILLSDTAENLKTGMFASTFTIPPAILTP
ncbi:IBR domain-containing protein [Trichophyton equinum CBS 127.97]|uniref:RBR-type E3 ubiquitin transferase n=1 Tax=Trichophyton equinum (strain ATCC MYA-4606 / CBS 127.97) TaxID=559882 RepID=F2Q2S5_TRIEC|nr:IBR domain-containing protein [Trichophyton equinum CBS 127.97]